ncbi:MAG TPA: hypothetical protein VGE07_03520 [Herpetosiphonaceae bacterium]
MRFSRWMVLLALALCCAACGADRPLAPVAPPDATTYQPGSDPQIDALIAREMADQPELALTTDQSHYVVATDPQSTFFTRSEQLIQFYERLGAPGWARTTTSGGGRIIYRAAGDPRLIVIRMSEIDAARILVTYAYRDRP